MKIKTHIESINAEIERLIYSAGEAAYGVWIQENRDFSALDGILGSIKQKRDEIARLESEYAAIDERDNQILGTSEAAATHPANAQAPAQTAVNAPATATDSGVTCPNCGAHYTTPARFCRKCGTQLRAD